MYRAEVHHHALGTEGSVLKRGGVIICIRGDEAGFSENSKWSHKDDIYRLLENPLVLRPWNGNPAT